MTEEATTETASLDEALQGAFDADDGPDQLESTESTLDEELVATLRGSDEDLDEEPVSGAPEGDASPEGTSDTYVVKVDGEEIEVTLDELLGGYQRTADYTRKTQTLAQEREELAAYKRFDAALQADPERAIRALAETLDISLGEAAAVAQQVNDDPLNGLVDPLEQKVGTLEAEIQSLRAQEAQRQESVLQSQRLAAVDAELEAVRATSNDPDFDESALLQFALDHNVGDLGVAYEAMKARAARSAAAAETARIVETKRTLPPVEGGRARSAGSTRTGGSNRMTVEESLDAALSELF